MIQKYYRTLFTLLSLIFSFVSNAQVTSFTSVPAATISGNNHTLNICAGSQVLFISNTHTLPENASNGANALQNPTTYNWSFGTGASPSTSSIQGPHVVTYNTPGTYNVTLTAQSNNLNYTQPITYTVNVSAGPSLSFTPALVSGTSVHNIGCTVASTYTMYQGQPYSFPVTVFQTVGTQNTCSCVQGPTVAIPNASAYPQGSTASIYWGGSGEGGQTTGPITLGSSAASNTLTSFTGQTNNFGTYTHYSNPGSYNLVFMVNINGCILSKYYIVNWGAGNISYNTVGQSVCLPEGLNLEFINQSPGNTYSINWGDGTTQTIGYPGLSTSPNTIPHQYLPSCTQAGSAQAYQIQITATNQCPTVSGSIPTTTSPASFYVSAPPTASFTSNPSPPTICQDQSMSFTNNTVPGLYQINGTCDDDYSFAWSILNSSSQASGFTLTSGALGNIITGGTPSITALFNTPGTYTVSMTASNVVCGNNTYSQTITVNPYPNITNQTVNAICTGGTFNLSPTNSPPSVIVPSGTTYSWVPIANANIGGEVSGSGSSITGTLTNTTGSVQTQVYTVTPQAGSCVGPTFTVSVPVYPSISISNASITVCNGSPFTFTPSSVGNSIPSGTSYTWTYVDNSNVTGEQSVSTSSSNISGQLSTTVYTTAQSVVYTVTANSGGTCPNDQFDLTVNINAINPGVIGSNQVYCAGNNPVPLVFTTSATATGTLSYQWQSSSSANGTFVNIANETSSSFDPGASIGVTTYYRVIITSTANQVSCSVESNVIEYLVNPNPAANAGTNFTKNCISNQNGGSIGMSPVSGINYSWSPTNDLTLANSSNPYADPSVTTTYTLTATNPVTGCTSTSSVTVTVNLTYPVANAGPDKNKSCVQNISGASIGTAAIANTSYTWTPNTNLTATSGAIVTANPGTTTTYTLTATNNQSGCTSQDQVTVFVDLSIPTVNAGVDFTKTCTQNASGLNIGMSPVSGVTYSWSPASGLNDPNIANPLANPTSTQNYTLTATQTSSGCALTDQVLVTVILTVPTALAGTPFLKTCTQNQNGANIGFAGQTNATYVWSPTTGLASATSSLTNANPLITTNYTLTATNTLSGCTASSSVLVSVDTEVPSVDAGSDFNKTCTQNPTGLQIGMTAVTGVSYVWSPITGLSPSNSSNPVANPSSNQTYTLTATDASSGCQATDQVVVNVNITPPAVEAGNNFTIDCNQNTTGSTIGMNAVNGVAYSWNPTTGLTNGSISNPTAAPASTQSYTLTATNSLNGCTATDQVLVTVNTTAPTATAGSGFIKNCITNTSGSQIGMASVSGVNYSWSPNTGLNSATVSNPTANPLVTTTYTLTAVNQGNGCSSTSNTVVTVNTQAPLANGGPDVEINCLQNTNGINIGMNPVSGINYSWTPVTGLSANNISAPLANPSVTTPYTFTATNPVNGCSSTDFITVTVNNALPIANAGTDFTIKCNLNPAGHLIGATALTGHTYSWSPALGLSDPNIANPNAFPSTTTTYTLTVTNVATGCSSTDQVVVTVNNTPPTSQVASSSTITCTSNLTGVSIGASTTSGLSYSWIPSSGLNSTIISNPTANPTSTTTYTLTTTNIGNGCSSTAQVLVTVNNNPPVVNVGADATITCLQNISGAAIGMSAANGITYSWTPTTALSSSVTSNTTANPTVTTTYTLTAVDPQNGCTASDAVIINVNNTAPIVNAGVDATISCTQNATGVQIGMSAEPSVSYQWTPTAGLSNNAISNPVANPTVNQQYTLVATNTLNGCTSNDVISLTVNNTYPIALSSAGFTKNCIQNASGATIGGQGQAGISYAWLPTTGLSSATISNPLANPTSTTTYTVNALNPNNGCSTSTSVLVVVDTQAPTANAGQDQLISCTSNNTLNGAPIGMISVSGINYSWSPSTFLSSAAISNPNATPTASQIYTLTAQDPSNGCASTDEVLVNVNYITPIANAGADATITCATNATGYQIGTAAGTGLTYSWSPVTGLSAANIAQPIALPLVTTTYTLTVTNSSSGCTHSDQVVVTVNNTDPIANAGTGFTKTCVNNLGAIQVGMNAVSGIQYSWTPSVDLNDATASNPTLNASTSTIYTLTAFNPVNGCDATDTIQVVVNQVLPIPNAGTDFNKTCTVHPNGMNIGSTNLSNHTYSWSPSLGLSSASVYNPLANPLTSTSYTLTLTNNLNGCQATDIVEVTVDVEVPVANAGPGLLRSCTSNTSGAQIGMTPVAGVAYSWTPSTGLSAANISNPIATPTSSTTYVLTATDQSSGCTATSSMVFTYNFTVPSVEAGNNFNKTCSTFPNGTVVGFSAVPTISYAWTPIIGLNNPNAASTIANPTQTTTYTLTATHPISGCTATDNVTVTVDIEIPAVNAGNSFTKTCVSNTTGMQIGMTPVAGVTYSWSPTSGLSAANIANPTANPTSTTTYTLTATDVSSQCTATSTVTVTVLTTSPVVEAGNPYTINCTNIATPAVLGTTGVSGLTYAWSPTTGLNDYTIAQPTANPSNSTNYVLTVTNPSTGCTSTDNVTITVNTTTPPVNAGNPFTITCVQFQNGSSIGSPGISGLTYLWSPSTGLGSTSIGQPIANPTATTTYNLLVTNPTNGCTSTGQVTVTVNKVIPIANAGPDGNITCIQTQPVQLGSTSTTGYGYLWTPSTSLSANNIANPTANPSATTTYNLTVTDVNNGCTATDQVIVTVNNTAPTVLANVVGNQTTVCAGSSVTLFGTGANTYSWSSGITNNQAFVPTATTTYTVTGTNSTNNCQATDVVTITVNPIPTVNPITSIVRCSGTATGAINFSGSVPGTIYEWSNSNTAINLVASNNGNIPSFTTTNNTPNAIVSTITVTPKFTFNGVLCTGTPQTFTITVNPIPTINTVNSFALCHGATSSAINFASSFGVPNTLYTWANANTGIGIGSGSTGNIASFSATNASSAPISGLISVTPSAANAGLTCQGTPMNFTITVNPIPSVDLVASQVVCNNSNTTAITFTGSVTGTVYSWTNSNAAINLGVQGISNISAFTATNTSNAPITGNFIVTPSYTNATGICTGTTTTFSITVNPTPTVNNISNQTICVGSSTNAVNFGSSFNVAGTSYSWTNSNTAIGLAASGSGNIPSFATTNSGVAPIVGLITVTPQITLGGTTCLGSPKNFNITVNPIPSITNPTDLVLCHNENSGVLNFSGSVANTTYSWSNNTTSINLGASGTGNISSFVAFNTSSSPVNATITITPSFGPTGSVCTGTSETFTITVNPIPTVNAVANQTICVGQLTQAINFTSTPAVVGTQYHWTNTNTSIGSIAASGVGNISAFNGVNNTTTVQNGVFSVTPKYTNLNHLCIGTPITFTLNVLPTPTVVDPQNIVVCNNAAVPALTFTGNVTGANYTWTNNLSSINLSSGSVGNIATFNAVNTTNSPVTAVIQVTPGYTLGSTTCSGNSESFNITVNPTPTVNTVSSSAYCVGSASNTVVFASSFGVAGTTYSWANGNTAIGLAATGNGNISSFNTTNTSNQSISGNITVTPTANACPGNPTNFNLTVNPIPTVNSVANQVKCNGSLSDAITFAGLVGGTTFNWSNNNPAINLGASGTGNIPSFTVSNATNTPIVATITVTPNYPFAGTTCTGNPITFTITVNPTPTVNQIANQAICVGSSSSIIPFSSAFGVSNTMYNWSNDNTSTGILGSGSGTFYAFNSLNSTNTVISSSITVTPSMSNGGLSCSGTPMTFNFAVNPIPVMSNPADQIWCHGSQTSVVTLTSNITGTTYDWSSNNTTIGIAASGTGNIGVFGAVNTGSSVQTSTVTITPSFTNGSATCQGVPQNMVFTVNPIPSVQAPTNQVICAGQNTSTVGFLGTATQYNWSNSNTSIGLAASGSGDIITFSGVNSTNVPQTGNIIVSPIFAFGGLTCTGGSQSFSISVNPSPIINYNQSSPQPVCSNSTTNSVTISSPTPNTSFNWSIPTIPAGITGLNVTSGTNTIPSYTLVNTTSVPITINFVVNASTSVGSCPGISSTY
ncbi:MAG: hypothetical protein RL207_2076, partial [Bacteroidota bacterium]